MNWLVALFAPRPRRPLTAVEAIERELLRLHDLAVRYPTRIESLLEAMEPFHERLIALSTGTS